MSDSSVGAKGRADAAQPFRTIDANISPRALEEMAMSQNKEAQFLLYKSYSKMKTSSKILQANELLAKSADSGYPPAQYTFGKLLLQGKIFGKNQVKGMSMLNSAANNKFTKAILFLAHVYENGLFVKQDSKSAVLFYQKAAENGSGSAENALGSFYQKGIMGLPFDEEQAIVHYQHAAELGHSIAKFNLSVLLKAKGEKEKAEKFLNEAAEEGVPQAQFNKTLTMDHITQKAEILKLLKSAADKGLTKACFSYGCAIEGDKNGNDVKYLKMAANKGHSHAQFRCSMLLRKTDPLQSRKYLEEAKKTIPEAALEYDARLEKACGDDPESLYLKFLNLRLKEPKKAIEFLELSAQSNHRDAMIHLAVEYDNGEITEKNYEKCNDLLNKLVSKKDGSAENLLAKSYELGNGVAVDLKRAEELYQLSFSHNCVTGGLNLARLLKLQKHYLEAGKVYSALYKQYKDPAVLYFYGRALLNGHCGERDPSGVKLIEQAAAAGFPTAIHNYGVMLYYGEGVPKNIEAGIKLFRESAKQPRATYKFALAQILISGFHTEKNEVEGYKLLDECTASGFVPAIVVKAKSLIQTDKPKAIELLKSISESETIDAQFKDAQADAQLMYAIFLKDSGNVEEAKKMFQNAAMIGNTEAMKALLSM